LKTMILSAELMVGCVAFPLSAEEGDGINCDEAEEVGACIQKEMDGVAFMDAVLKKRNCVKTLQLLHKGVMVDGKTMFIHNHHLFSGLVVLVEQTADMAPYFCCEMTPLPAALFRHPQMRKANKAALGQVVTKMQQCHLRLAGLYTCLIEGRCSTG